MSRNIVRFDPFAELDSLSEQLFDEGIFTMRRRSVPTTDVYTEDDNRLTVETHLPDFDEQDISVDLEGGSLVIQAQKHEREEDKNKKYVVRESSSSFYRRIALPEQADDGSVEATFDKGVLRVVVPFNSAPSSKKVAIRSGAAEKQVTS